MESHMIHITQRAHMSLTGLEKVISMEPELVEVETTADHLAIKGRICTQRSWIWRRVNSS